MPVIFAASESIVQVDNKPLDGVLSIDYRFTQARKNVYALGSAERITTVAGPQAVEGVIRVASTSAVLNGKTGDSTFQITATLKHGKTSMEVGFDECLLTGKSFELGVGGNGEAVYTFTAIRVREDPPKA